MKIIQSLKFYYDLADKNLIVDTKMSLEKVNQSFNNLQRILKNNNFPIYGIHTGYGSNVNDLKNSNDWKEDQIELLHYLKVGTGEYLDDDIVRRALRIQALKIAKGYSGTSPQVYQKLWEISNKDTLAKVPKFGSLGASGDLIPMAHAVFPIFNELEPFGPRDVISLVNTNAMMASYAVEMHYRVSRLIEKTFDFISQATIGINANMGHFDLSGFSMNPQQEYKDACIKVLEYREKNFETLNTKDDFSNDCVQEKYSIRCLPQVMGHILRNLDYCEKLIIDEVNQLSDNPVILDEETVWHGGHFYAISIATSCDLMQDACIRVCELVDRIVLNLMAPEQSKGLPTNLKIDKNDHLKGIHQLISSLFQRAKGLNYPSSLMSFSCEGNNQDIVPCSMNTLNQLSDLVYICDHVLRAGSFCSQRAMLLRLNKEIPENLQLNAWE